MHQIFNSLIIMKKITLLLVVTTLSIVSLSAFKTALQMNRMVRVEGGTYKMGSKDSDKTADNDEQKEHDVTIKTFEISKFEVTVWEWKQ